VKRFRSLLLTLLVVLSACGEGEREKLCTSLIGGGSYCLQPTTGIKAFDAQQKVDTRFRDRHDTLIVDLEVDAEGLRFVGLTPFGHKLVQLSFDNHLVTATTLPDSRLSPTLLVAMLQLAQWPADAVRAGLEPPLMLEESADQRRILNRGDVVLTIDHSVGQPPYRRIHIFVPGIDLEISIETLVPAPAAVTYQ
jgi:hypothetical protein